MTTCLIPVLLSIAIVMPQDPAPKAPSDPSPQAPAKEGSRRQRKSAAASEPEAPAAPRAPVDVPKDMGPIITTAVERLVAMQEDPGQWP